MSGEQKKLSCWKPNEEEKRDKEKERKYQE